MKTKKVEYTNDQGAMDEFDGALTRAEETALGIPAPGRVTRIVRSPQSQPGSESAITSQVTRNPLPDVALRRTAC